MLLLEIEFIEKRWDRELIRIFSIVYELITKIGIRD